MKTHTFEARQQNDREIMLNADLIEAMDAKIAALAAERADMYAKHRALLAMSDALREDAKS